MLTKAKGMFFFQITHTIAYSSESLSIFRTFLFWSVMLLNSGENWMNASENLGVRLVDLYWSNFTSAGLETWACSLEAPMFLMGLFCLCLTCSMAQVRDKLTTVLISVCSFSFWNTNFMSFWKEVAVLKICPSVRVVQLSP